MLNFIKRILGLKNINNKSLNNDTSLIINSNKYNKLTSSTYSAIQQDIVVLWILSTKKNVSTDQFKIPKYIINMYNLNVDKILKNLISQKLISNINGNLIVEDSGWAKLKEYNCIIIMHLHPEYDLSINDFVLNTAWHQLRDNDIIWGIFNKRILTYTQEQMWSSLALNYGHMASLLYEEGKYTQALDFLFAKAFLVTSGMRDDNILTNYPIDVLHYEITRPLIKINKNLKLSTYELEKKYCESQLVASLQKILPFYYYDIPVACDFVINAYKTGETKGLYLETDALMSHKNIPDINETNKYCYRSAENLWKKYHS